MRDIRFHDDVKRKKPYYLGLDVGTNTVGWAVTDPKYRVIRRAGKSLWGVRHFTDAETAAERRQFRTTRRRLKRRKQRLKLLQEIFAQEITAVDPGFFQRLNDSAFYPEDKSTLQPNSLFNDTDYDDRAYHEAYPTIYHLRKELMEDATPHDPRLVYLACHHIMKYRGHFLFNNLSVQSDVPTHETLEHLMALYEVRYGMPAWPTDAYDEVIRILSDKQRTRSDKHRGIKGILQDDRPAAKELARLVSGLKASIDKLLEEAVDPEIAKSASNKLELSKTGLDEDAEKLEGLDEDATDYLQAAENFYNAHVLQSLLTDVSGRRYRSISEAHIATYEQHGEDLAMLKETVKALDRTLGDALDTGDESSLYNVLFRATKGDNYVAYSGHLSRPEEAPQLKRCSYDAFASFLKKKIEQARKLLESRDEKDMQLIEACDEILEGLKQETFLRKITSSENGVIPHQLHGRELEQILDHAVGYLSFIDEQDKERILQLFNYRIPYYVGPYDDREEESEYAWIVRRNNTPIRPWNLQEVVDIPATAEAFIRNLTNKCTYLVGEDVLPKESLLYSEFVIRQHLNVLTVGSKRIEEKEIRDALYRDLFVTASSGRVTKNKIFQALRSYGYDVEGKAIGGIDQSIPTQLKAYHDFANLGELPLTLDEMEEIILKVTAFSGSPKILREWLETTYADVLTEEQIRRISHFRYSGWGRLSKKFLDGIKHRTSDGRSLTIIEVMREKPLNLMEILHHEDYTFQKQIDRHNMDFVDDPQVVTEEYMDNLRLSPPVRKGIRQTLLLIQEIVKIMGGAPERVFVEMARERSDSGRTVSRKTQVQRLYEGLSDDDLLSQSQALWEDELKDIEEDRFKSKRLYLYARQLGRCMYTGQPIDIHQLYDQNVYDIDHIYPRSLTKDDSWNNLVLVKREANALKRDHYPIDAAVQSKMRGFWHALRRKGFISDEKLKRLTGKARLSAEQLSGFINRQLVETRQSTKNLATILGRVLSETEIVYVKAGLVSDFRYNDGLKDALDRAKIEHTEKEGRKLTEFYFPKVRELNSYHHAKDAYLNVVVGNAYHCKFTKTIFARDYVDYRNLYNMNYFFDEYVIYKDDVIWEPGQHGSIRQVTKQMARNDILLTYETFRKEGGFYDQTIYKKGLAKIPVKSDHPALRDTQKYGGYSGVSNSFFTLIRHKKRKKQLYSLVPIPLLLVSGTYQQGDIKDYLEETGLRDVEIILPEVKINSIVEFKDTLYRIRGKSGNKVLVRTYAQAKYTPDKVRLFKEVERSLAQKKVSPSLTDETLDQLYADLANKLMRRPFSEISILKGTGDKLKSYSERFQTLDPLTKAKVIMEIAHLMNGVGATSNLSAVYHSGGSKVGKMGVTMNTTDCSDICVHDMSITGFFTRTRKVT